MTRDEVPVGRRVAQWRIRRRMTQQMLADRLGKSKSWVDKVERGVRALDRFSVIEELARVLRVDLAALLGREVQPPVSGGDGVDGIRAALARYDVSIESSTDDLGRRVDHARSAYRHARYSQLVRLIPGLLDTTRSAHAAGRSQHATGLLVRVYRITSSVLVKLGEPDVAWLAADRAVAAAAGDPRWTAVAVVPLGQALRVAGRARLAMTATTAVAERITPGQGRERTPVDLALGGTLWVEAALAAAAGGDARRAAEWLDLAAELADQVVRGAPGHGGGFGPAHVRAARVAAAVELGDGAEAVTRHEVAVRADGWLRLSPEHRAAYLVDAARAYLQVGDLLRAGRALTDADRIAPEEVRMRPLTRTVIAELARDGPASAGVARLTAAVGLSHP
ncbi:helix-turn-helix domain-containing protein [Micromonospora sp. NPDC049282]|uniref:helix-turn-helix domain-containing protein n=1 Tax=Micromonospora sp. NPDC049282 TaxID=3364269 RepID=UPI003710E43A